MTWVGPYLAENKYNDTSIFQHIIKTNGEDIRSWLSEDDIAIVDRGFRNFAAARKIEHAGRKAIIFGEGTKANEYG